MMNVFKCKHVYLFAYSLNVLSQTARYYAPVITFFLTHGMLNACSTRGLYSTYYILETIHDPTINNKLVAYGFNLHMV